jgi:uncharacterized protein (TIGR02266 family)
MSSMPQRAAKRAQARLQVNYTHEGCYLISFSRDISVDGIYVCTDNPAPVGTGVRLVFPFPHHQEMSCAARVVWSDPDGRTGQRGMGLQFLDPPPRLQEVILDLVNRIAILGADALRRSLAPLPPPLPRRDRVWI